MTQQLRKVVGQAVANKVGEYVSPAGNRFPVAEGEVFDLVEGLEKSKWFTPVKPGQKPVFAKAETPTEVPGAGPKRGSKVKIDPTGGDEIV